MLRDKRVWKRCRKEKDSLEPAAIRFTLKHLQESARWSGIVSSSKITVLAKYLAATITNKLLWSEISNKANSIRALLQRKFGQCKLSVKSNCYTTHIPLILEYASTVWSPHLACDITKIEMIQWCSAKFDFNDFRRTSSVTSILNHFTLANSWNQKITCKNEMMLYFFKTI